MPKLVPTIAITVIRDKKRVTPEANGKAFDFTAEEVAAVKKQHPSAFRKPINETTESVGDDATSPEKTVKTTANKPNGKKKTVKAAEADSTSDEALDTENDETETEGDDGDDTTSEDDDI